LTPLKNRPIVAGKKPLSDAAKRIDSGLILKALGEKVSEEGKKCRTLWE